MSLLLPKPKREPKRRVRVRKVRRTRPGVPSMKALDDLARFLCRSRGVCEARGWKGSECKGVLQWAHIVGREYKRNALRWRMDNCLCLCQGHHFRWTKKNLPEWHEFLYHKIGQDKFTELEREALYGAKVDRRDVFDTLSKLAAARKAEIA